MKYYVTIYIDILFEKELLKLDATHAFLGLTKDKNPDELDKIDSEIRMQKVKNADWKDIDKRWYENLETDEYNDGFWGFGTGIDSVYNTAGKVFQNNQYVVDNNVKTNTYEIKKLNNTWQSNLLNSLDEKFNSDKLNGIQAKNFAKKIS